MAKDIKSLFRTTPVKQIMMTPAHTVHQDDSLSVAEEIFINHGISHLPVVNSQHELVGILSHKYLYKTVSPRKFAGTDMSPNTGMILDGESYYWKDALDKYILKSVMNRNAFSMNQSEPLSEAVTQMARKNIGCITIVDEHKKVTGILTNQEIVKFAAQQIAA